MIQISRDNEIIFNCTAPFYVPRIGEKIALAKWDTVYRVIDVFTVFGKSSDVQTVTIKVEIIND